MRRGLGTVFVLLSIASAGCGIGDATANFAAAIGNATVLGLSPREIGELTLWEYSAAIHEYNRRQSGLEDKAPVMDETRFDELMA